MHLNTQKNRRSMASMSLAPFHHDVASSATAPTPRCSSSRAPGRPWTSVWERQVCDDGRHGGRRVPARAAQVLMPFMDNVMQVWRSTRTPVVLQCGAYLLYNDMIGECNRSVGGHASAPPTPASYGISTCICSSSVAAAVGTVGYTINRVAFC